MLKIFKQAKSLCTTNKLQYLPSVCVKCHSNNAIPEEFTTIYRFPYIRALGIVNRLKIYQTALTGLTIPSSYVLSQLNVVPQEIFTLASIFGITGCITLYSVGVLTSRFIGFVYLDKQENTIKLSYLDFWGRRKDKLVPLDDMKPFSQSPISKSDWFFMKIYCSSDKSYLKMNMKYGEILDLDKFNKVFL